MPSSICHTTGVTVTSKVEERIYWHGGAVTVIMLRFGEYYILPGKMQSGSIYQSPPFLADDHTESGLLVLRKAQIAVNYICLFGLGLFEIIKIWFIFPYTPDLDQNEKVREKL